MYRIFVLSVIVLMSSASAEAETTRLTLRDAMSMALESNSQIKAARFTSQGAAQGIQSANARYLPSVNFEETLAASNSPTSTFMMKLDEGRFTANDFAISSLNNPSVSHDFKTALSIQQPLFDPALSPLKEMAVKDAQKSELELEAVRQGIAFQVFYTYLELQKAQSQLAATEKAVTDARENLRLADVRISAGVGLRSDNLRARTHLSSVEQLLGTAQNNLTLTRIKLAMLAGLPDDASFEITPFQETMQVPEMSDQVLKDALENRVEMKRSRTDLEKSEAAVTLARSDYLPTVGAFASYQLNAKDAPFLSDNDAWSAGISLKWNLFDGFRSGSERSRAVSGQSAARETLSSTTQDIRYQLRESYVRRDEVAKRRDVSRLALQDAEETVRLVSKRFENSLATMVELLDAQTALNQARANLVESEAGYAFAGGRVYYMTGTFVKEMLK
jgi:outer membrane protein TolC